MSPNLLLASSSRCHPYDYLDHCHDPIRRLFADVSEIVFVPYARPGGISHDEYTQVARRKFAQFDIRVKGIHESDTPSETILRAEGVFVGGGNTFVLLQALYDHDLITTLSQRINEGMPYMGTSAGSNIAGLTIGTSNDMPIVQPKSLQALGVVPFNINPHFPTAPPDPTHRGETRADRIQEFHIFNRQPVVALHEDGMLRIEGESMQLIGARPALVFHPGCQEPATVPPGRLTL